MTTSSVPSARESAVAEPKKAANVPPAPARTPEPKLAPAGASGDAGVQFLVAERYAHAASGDTARLADIDRQLADLGFTAE